MKNNSIVIIYMTKQTKRRSVRKPRRNKSTKKIRTQKKVGGNKGEFKSLLLSLLNDKYIIKLDDFNI